MENMANKPGSGSSKEKNEGDANVKQAVVPKAMLREILQSSDKEVEGIYFFHLLCSDVKKFLNSPLTWIICWYS